MKKKQLELDIILGRTEMDYYILSIESIMKKPEILYQSHECNLILPDFIYDEIHKLATKSFYFKEVINVIDESDITIEETDIAVNSSMLYLGLIKFAELFANKNSSYNVFLVTKKKNQKTKLGFTVISAQYFSIRNTMVVNNLIISRIRFARDGDNRLFIIVTILSLLVFVLGILSMNFLIQTFVDVSKYLSILCIPLICFLLYSYRCTFRLSYGMVEFLFGCYISISLFFGEALFTFGASEWIQFLSGLYIVVRGLDNIGKGLEPTRFSYLWSCHFSDFSWHPMEKSSFQDYPL